MDLERKNNSLKRRMAQVDVRKAAEKQFRYNLELEQLNALEKLNKWIKIDGKPISKNGKHLTFRPHWYNKECITFGVHEIPNDHVCTIEISAEGFAIQEWEKAGFQEKTWTNIDVLFDNIEMYFFDEAYSKLCDAAAV
jgi:hypothetical protein